MNASRRTDRVRPIALIGLRCVGKTTVGRLLASRLRLPFADLDRALAALDARRRGARPALPAGLVLRALGEPGFRELEAAALGGLLAEGEVGVLATGGGVVTTAAGREALTGGARCVWLRAAPALLASRLAADPTPRPALLGGDPLGEVEALAARRGPLYAGLADLTLDVDELSPGEVVDRLQSELADGRFR